jgi:SAM-dependent methyltransferase
MSVESFLGSKRRTNCEALEELRWGTKLNLGPGSNWKRPGWTAMDCYKKCDVNIDFRKKGPFPFEDNTISIIFTSHMLEHMDNESGINIANECYRVLKPGGILRVVVPDLEKALLACELKDIEWFLTSGMELTGNTVERLLVNFVAAFSLRHNKDGPISYSGGPVVEPDEVRNFLEKCDDAEEFIEWCVSKIPDDAPYRAHVNGFTAHKLEKWIKGTGFRHFVISGYRTSIVPEMRLAGFDNHAAASLFVEGMK